MSGGYMGRILRVDLGGRSLSSEPLPGPEVLRRFVGGTGLGLYYLRQAPPGGEEDAPVPCEDGESEAPLVFMTGPLTGTLAPSSADYTTVCRSLEAPHAIGVAHSHGFWAAYLKFAGYDGIVIEGRSDRHVLLVLDEGHAEIRDAEHLWGLDTRETERLVKEELGGDPEKISVACIGPGGEAMLHGGMIKNDRNHSAGKGSPGAIMGSKHLKAIAVRGTKAVPIAKPSAFQAAVACWEEELGGGGEPVGRAKVYAADFSRSCSRWRVTPRPSYNCKIECSYDLDIAEGPFAGFTTSISGGADSLEGAAAMIGVDDPGVALALADFYDALGLESHTVGRVIAMAFEAYQEGRITSADTGGLALTRGNYEAAMELVSQVIADEGYGRNLAAQLAKTAGSSPAEEKGGEAKARESEVSYERRNKMWNDCTGACWFASVPAKTVGRAVGAAVGWDDFGGDEALEVGERVVNALLSATPQRESAEKSGVETSPCSREARSMGPAVASPERRASESGGG